MPTYLLDTDTFTRLHKGDANVRRRVAAMHPYDDLVVSVITVEEVLSGWYAQLRKARTPDQIEVTYDRMIDSLLYLSHFLLWGFPKRVFAEYETLLKAKLNVRRNDLRIAATARVRNATVVTANTRDFARVPGLVIEDWTAPPGP